MHIREGSQRERESFFMLGFDAWGGGKTEQAFLEALRPVQRYDVGTWYVLEGHQHPCMVLAFRDAEVLSGAVPDAFQGLSPRTRDWRWRRRY